MSSAAFVFPAVKEIQAKREYFISIIPLDVMAKILQFANEKLPPEVRSQRVLNKARIPEIRDYILSHPDTYVFSALTVSVDGEIDFDTASDTTPQIGTISISMTSRFLINDGQHRRTAIAEAIKMNPAFKNEHISVVFYRDEGLQRSQQMFSDLNRYAIKPTKSINILFKFCEESSIITKAVIEKVPVFNGLIEKERTTISNRSKAMFTLSAISTATIEILNGLEDDISEKNDLAVAFWNEVAKHITQWNEVKCGTRKSSNIRKDTIYTLSITLVAIGYAGHALFQEYPSNRENKTDVLEGVYRNSQTPSGKTLFSSMDGLLSIDLRKKQCQNI